MDINYYLQREQVERVRADRAASSEARAAHSQLAEGYRGLLEDYRRDLLSDVGVDPATRPPLL